MKIYVGKNVTGYLKASLSLDTMMRYSCDGKIISGNINAKGRCSCKFVIF